MTEETATTRSRRWRAPAFALAIPSIVWYLLFFVLPIAFIVWYSFGTRDITRPGIPVDLGRLSLSNYGNVLDPTFFDTFRGTIRIAVIATLMCVVIGLPVAYFAAFKVTARWRAILLATVVVPSFTSFLIRTVAWRIPLSPNGTFSKWLIDLGWVGENGIQILYTSTAVQIAMIYNYLGFMILPLYVALDRIEPQMREASKDLGAGRFATFFSVTLPLAGPGVIAGVLLTFIPMCGDYIAATVLGGAKGNMIGAMVAAQFMQAQNWPLGAAMAVMMIVSVLLVLAVAALVFKVFPRLPLTPATQAVIRRLRRARHARTSARIASGEARTWAPPFEPVRAALAAWTALVLLFLLVPIMLVLLHSFNRGQSFTIWSGGTSTKWWAELFDGTLAWSILAVLVAVGAAGAVASRLLARRSSIGRNRVGLVTPAALTVAVIAGWYSTNGYRDIFDYAGVGDAIRNSFIAAFGATVIAVIIGGLAGTALARRPGLWAKVFMVVLFFILVTPEIMDAVALVTWFPRIDDVPLLGRTFAEGWGPFSGGMNKLWVGQSLYASAVVTLIVRARLSGLDASLEEAAADLGATPARAFRQITLPLITPALAAGALLSFTLCLDNAVVSSLISSAGSTTFPVALLGATKSTIKPFWGAGAVMLFAVTMAALAYVAVVLKRSGSSSTDIAATLTGT